MSTIDYEALGQIVREFALAEPDEETARRVAAAYRIQQQFQGIIEIRADRLRNMAEQNGRFPMSDAGFDHLIENWKLREGIE